MGLEGSNLPAPSFTGQGEPNRPAPWYITVCFVSYCVKWCLVWCVWFLLHFPDNCTIFLNWTFLGNVWPHFRSTISHIRPSEWEPAFFRILLEMGKEWKVIRKTLYKTCSNKLRVWRLSDNQPDKIEKYRYGTYASVSFCEWLERR